MRNAVRLVVVLGLACLLAPRTNAQEGGGLQPPLNADPVVPLPADPFYTAAELALRRRSVFEMPPSTPARPPKPGEHLGEYLIAERVPRQMLPPAEPRLSEAVARLRPKGESWRDEIRLWSHLLHGSARPRLGVLPPKPGEGLGEYALAGELPARSPAPETKLPTTTIPLPPR